MTVPLFVVFKAFWDIITNIMVFGQEKNFYVGLTGVMLNFVFCKGYFGVIILTLKTVVDEQAASIAVSFALLSIYLNNLVMGTLLSLLNKHTDINKLLLYFSAAP